MFKKLWILPLCLALVFAAGCGSDSSSTSTAGGESSTATKEGSSSATVEQAEEEAAKRTKPKVVPPKGAPSEKLVTKDLVEGTGPEAKAGDEVSLQYVGVDYKTGKQFDASWDRGEPITFELGSNAVIAGWEQGLEGMKVGGRRELIIPPGLAYGPEGVQGLIAPNAHLVFVVDLLKAK